MSSCNCLTSNRYSTSGGLVSSQLRCYCGRTLVPLQCRVSPQEAERKGKSTNHEQHQSLAHPALPCPHAEVGEGLPFHSHGHPGMKFSTAKAMAQIMGRGSLRGGQAPCVGRWLGEQQKAVTHRGRGADASGGQGCPHSGGSPSHASLLCTGIRTMEKQLWTVFPC